MSKAEALGVLGLSAGATEEEIIQAHRKLISRFHPDKGGSDYLAAQINQAKKILLGR
jgi:DnaJ-class molecular chaperone